MPKSEVYQARRAAIDAKSTLLRAKLGFSNNGAFATGAPDDAASLATFQLLYESEDKRFCLFETADQHLSAVNASKLA